MIINPSVDQSESVNRLRLSTSQFFSFLYGVPDEVFFETLWISWISWLNGDAIITARDFDK